jgi:L-fuculose-phosphate aldolase
MDSQLIDRAKKFVCDSGKRLLLEGLVARTWGNVSMRINERQMVITPSGRKYEELSPEDMVVVNYLDYSYIGPRKPSSELKLHCEIYKRRKNVDAVIHTHQMYASIVAAAQRNVEVMDPQHREILGCSTVLSAPYALPNTRKITMATADALGQNYAAIMANHGVVCCGTDLEDVFLKCRTLEDACRVFIEHCKLEAV